MGGGGLGKGEEGTIGQKLNRGRLPPAPQPKFAHLGKVATEGRSVGVCPKEARWVAELVLLEVAVHIHILPPELSP